eukprot:TRINITY_DN9399_c0_g2_i1.p1 TRINITY_DN9399_c0_g2~~TRINITY_DN9399_c0_g2_i1.p1  ORF type:complete len:905 (-),score=196.72 TRINITY_DN9399_c0_g2_i1:1428-4142(-)
MQHREVLLLFTAIIAGVLCSSNPCSQFTNCAACASTNGSCSWCLSSSTCISTALVQSTLCGCALPSLAACTEADSSKMMVLGQLPQNGSIIGWILQPLPQVYVMRDGIRQNASDMQLFTMILDGGDFADAVLVDQLLTPNNTVRAPIAVFGPAQRYTVQLIDQSTCAMSQFTLSFVYEQPNFIVPFAIGFGVWVLVMLLQFIAPRPAVCGEAFAPSAPRLPWHQGFFQGVWRVLNVTNDAQTMLAAETSESARLYTSHLSAQLMSTAVISVASVALIIAYALLASYGKKEWTTFLAMTFATTQDFQPLVFILLFFISVILLMFSLFAAHTMTRRMQQITSLHNQITLTDAEQTFEPAVRVTPLHSVWPDEEQALQAVNSLIEQCGKQTSVALLLPVLDDSVLPLKQCRAVYVVCHNLQLFDEVHELLDDIALQYGVNVIFSTHEEAVTEQIATRVNAEEARHCHPHNRVAAFFVGIAAMAILTALLFLTIVLPALVFTLWGYAINISHWGMQIMISASPGMVIVLTQWPGLIGTFLPLANGWVMNIWRTKLIYWHPFNWTPDPDGRSSMIAEWLLGFIATFVTPVILLVSLYWTDLNKLVSANSQATSWLSDLVPHIRLIPFATYMSNCIGAFYGSMLLQQVFLAPAMELIHLPGIVRGIVSLCRRHNRPVPAYFANLYPYDNPRLCEFPYSPRIATTMILRSIALVCVPFVPVMGPIILAVTVSIAIYDRYRLMYLNRRPASAQSIRVVVQTAANMRRNFRFVLLVLFTVVLVVYASHNGAEPMVWIIVGVTICAMIYAVIVFVIATVLTQKQRRDMTALKSLFRLKQQHTYDNADKAGGGDISSDTTATAAAIVDVAPIDSDDGTAQHSSKKLERIPLTSRTVLRMIARRQSLPPNVADSQV